MEGRGNLFVIEERGVEVGGGRKRGGVRREGGRKGGRERERKEGRKGEEVL